jgi:radical SAM superfamily enzyme YgiQ (UPF0313 family)
MKITFLIPPVLDGFNNVDRCFGCNYSIYFLPLLPALYVATLLKKETEKISVIDFPAQKKTEQDFKEFIENDNSDIYIFYTVFLCQNTDLIARRLIRGRVLNARFIFCGPQPTWAPEVFLDKSDTVVIRGEPEFISREVIRILKANSNLGEIKGISYRQDTEIIHNQAAPYIMDIDQIPIPDRTLLDHRPYFNPKLRKLPHTAVLTSRGCYGRCWFCVPNSLSYARELEYKKQTGRKPPPRLHSTERVIEEFNNIANLGFKSVSVIDDEFLWSEERTLQVCAGIENLKLEWSCLCRPDMINAKVAEALARAGCSYVDLGTESFDEGVLNAIGKDLAPSDTRKAVSILKNYHIAIELNVLLGATPQETEATIKKTLREVKRLNVDYVLFSIANPFPGTDFYYAAKKNGWMVYGDYVPVDPAKESIIYYPHLSKEKLQRYLSYAYLSYYFNPLYILKQIFQIKGIRDLRNKLMTAFNFIKRNYL